jgi:hypothetical protein
MKSCVLQCNSKRTKRRAGARTHVPGRCESIALRSPCFAQALGIRSWTPVERMRSTHGRGGKRVLRFTPRPMSSTSRSPGSGPLPRNVPAQPSPLHAKPSAGRPLGGVAAEPRTRRLPYPFSPCPTPRPRSPLMRVTGAQYSTSRSHHPALGRIQQNPRIHHMEFQ